MRLPVLYSILNTLGVGCLDDAYAKAMLSVVNAHKSRAVNPSNFTENVRGTETSSRTDRPAPLSSFVSRMVPAWISVTPRSRIASSPENISAPHLTVEQATD